MPDQNVTCFVRDRLIFKCGRCRHPKRIARHGIRASLIPSPACIEFSDVGIVISERFEIYDDI